MRDDGAKKRSNADIDAELQIASEPYKQMLLQAGDGGIDLLTYWLLEKKGLARTYARKYRGDAPETEPARAEGEAGPD